MKITELEKKARKTTKFLKKLSLNYRELMINTVNEAFDHNYTSEDEIEILSYKAFSVKTDKERIYECKLAPSAGHCLALCIIERESRDSIDGKAQLNFDELILNLGRVAVITAKDEHKADRINCIIDTPGGAIKFAIPTVRLNYESRQIIDLLTLWAE